MSLNVTFFQTASPILFRALSSAGQIFLPITTMVSDIAIGCLSSVVLYKTTSSLIELYLKRTQYDANDMRDNLSVVEDELLEIETLISGQLNEHETFLIHDINRRLSEINSNLPIDETDSAFPTLIHWELRRLLNEKIKLLEKKDEILDATFRTFINNIHKRKGRTFGYSKKVVTSKFSSGAGSTAP